jgi:Uma2 family endonuclease
MSEATLTQRTETGRSAKERIAAYMAEVDEQWALELAEWHEIIDGERVEMTGTGGEHNLIVGNMADAFRPFVQMNRLGLVFVDGMTFEIPNDSGPDRFRPDLAFVARQSIPVAWDVKKPFPGAPTLAVEVVSPGDKAAVLTLKIDIYLAAGTAQVLVLYPSAGQVLQYRADTRSMVHIYRDDQPIDLSALLPGLTITPRQCFVLPDWLGDEAAE